jgi:EAL and modified HD-GYP domain-containing signal transduction protein
LAFVNATRNFLVSGDISWWPQGRIVIEVLEDIEPDQRVIDSLRRLRSQGYTIALDDYVYREDLDPLVQLADIVKLDLPLIPKDDLARQIKHLQSHKVEVLAEKVETYDDFQLCKDLGCDYFQGYFFCRPRLVSHPKLQSNRAAVLHLLVALQDPDISATRIEALLETDATLCYRVLRYVNSAQFAPVEKVESVRHSAALMGISRIKSFAAMILMASISDRKPAELFNVAMTRAKTCEILARQMGADRPDRLFTIGMVSAFDALLDMPMTEVIDLLPLAADMNDAILNGSGRMGEILACVLEHEAGKWPFRKCGGLRSEAIVEAYLEAIEWATECAQLV